MTPSAERVRTALADAWEAQGRRRTGQGGDVAALAGVRLMASGLAPPRFNGGDVEDPDLVDIAAVRDWYAARRVPAWGLRVPTGLPRPWPWGRRLLTQRLMVLGREDGRPGSAAVPAGLTLRAAGPGDLDAVVAVDAEAFGDPPAEARPWLRPLLTPPGAVVALAGHGDDAVGTGYALYTEGRAGPAVAVGGVAVAAAWRRRGVGSAVSRWLVDWGFTHGAALSHLQPDTEAAARVYRRLGFTEVPGIDIFVDC